MAKAPRRYYTPGQIKTDVSRVSIGVVQVGQSGWANCYSGEKGDLVAAGLLPSHLFPGEPGQPLTAATFYPVGAAEFDPRWKTPGLLVVNKAPSGKFRVRVMVCAEESNRRNAEAAERKRSYNARNEAVDRFSPAGFRGWLGLDIGEFLEMSANGGYLREVRAEVERWLRESAGAHPRRTQDHLRLVWSAPAS